ncbi:DNA mismatch repair endonuclease MutL [Psychrosphaera sp. 1_MG-2023]|uniref:DNA mismatch repair endonuclease MutL n=1 Tax=Psychrosphaera sp. 1_MG-2023 TaxID=3062643 RepID=UPI0026E135D3|nr:DNA mismatch repair endonuclease MutL [Psychrosphaera sp. 1_MG-2023]MDO6718129.1 DNA mismatch repair endonuclease MutL [Psychrosphaera sp. 1_MG-2023]
MPIQILPPQLANQIAAGEVVERPASVVKELVENALDAGATKVEVEIDRGGQKRILIRDNGKGIVKDELALALSRHATSKISCLDDLEAIHSLGFRGEALASISSVSRLTLTSKPQSQNEAWAASAEGLNMAVAVKPAAHPNGTSIEVLDLFFNTPARRKFLRADKTEFNHIELLIKRIAMSRPEISFVLKHNGKTIKRYRGQGNESDWQQQMSGRLAEVINQRFVDQCQYGYLQYDDVEISVWVNQPELCAGVNPSQYAFVNGRMMRDKLLQHAIRQGYGDSLHSEQQPEYVITVNLPATDVDVNVHPAKHEVRFHHSRLIHDLVVRTVQEAIEHFYQLPETGKGDGTKLEGGLGSAPDDYQKAFEQTEIQKSCLTSLDDQPQSAEGSLFRRDADGFLLKRDADGSLLKRDAEGSLPSEAEGSLFTGAAEGSEQRNESDGELPVGDEAIRRVNERADNEYAPTAQKPRMNHGHSVQISNRQRQAFDNFANSVDELTADTDAHHQQVPTSERGLRDSVAEINTPTNNLLSICYIEQDRYVYFIWQNTFYLFDMLSTMKLNPATPINLTPAPLLVPVRLKLTKDELQWCSQHIEQLKNSGFETKLHGQYIIIKQVPSVLRSSEVGRTLPRFFENLMATETLTETILVNILKQTSAQPISGEQIRTTFNEYIKNGSLDVNVLQHSAKLSASAILTKLVN